MEREIYAKFILDEDKFKSYGKQMTPMDYFEGECGWMNDSGIAMEFATILDKDSTDEWERYCNYLMEWIIHHIPDYNKGMSPACFDEWRDMEDNC